MKRFLLFIAFIASAGVASAQSSQSATATQTMSPAEEERMAFASKAMQLDAALQRNVPAAATEYMNGLMADMQKHIGRATREMSSMTDAAGKAELNKRIATQSDIYGAVKLLSVNTAANREALNTKLREFVKVM